MAHVIWVAVHSQISVIRYGNFFKVKTNDTNNGNDHKKWKPSSNIWNTQLLAE